MNEVHIWTDSHSVSESPDESLKAFLPQAECSKADSLQVEAVRNRFIRSRVLLRQVLASYVGLPPKQLEFQYSAEGKPSVVGAGSKVHFNLSHSAGLIVVAVDVTDPVGVDVEAVRPIKNADRILDRVLAVGEMEAWAELKTSALREEYFYTTWTRKESLCKAIGVGIFTSTVRTDVRDTNPLASWYIQSLQLCVGYAAAVTTVGHKPVVVRSFMNLAAGA